MFDFYKKEKRQIELLGLCIGRGSRKLTIDDMAEFFNVEALTIKRDMSSLREMGISIHSTQKDGIIVDKTIETATIASLAIIYLTICSFERRTINNRSVGLLLNKLRENQYKDENIIINMAVLQVCSEKCLYATVEFWQPFNPLYTNEVKKDICPVCLMFMGGYWRVLADDNGTAKQFPLDCIKSVKMTYRSYGSMRGINFREAFSNSWNYFISDKKINVKLRLSKEKTAMMFGRQYVPDQEIIVEDNGESVMKATVNSLGEIAEWIIGKGEGIYVLEPESLRIEVIRMAKTALKNYE